MLSSCSYRSIRHGHTCRWELCPYKGVTAELAHRSVVSYTGEAYTDAYCIDMLHLQYPTEEYQQLEERLFNNTK